MGKPAFRNNPETGKLEKLIKGKYVPQREMGFWKDLLKIARQTRRNVDAVGRREGELKTMKDGRVMRFTREGSWVPADTTFTKGKQILDTDSSDTSGSFSPSPLMYNPPKDTTSTTGPFGGANIYKELTPQQIAARQFVNPPDLDLKTPKLIKSGPSGELQIEPSPDTTTSYEDVLKMKRGKERDKLTIKHWEEKGYNFKGLRTSEMRRLANDLRIGHAREFTGTDGKAIHFKPMGWKGSGRVFKRTET